jgi:hypothetical protein
VEHQLGRIDIVAWQIRRQPIVRRPGPLSTALALLAGASALLLLLRFALGVPAPLGALQVAFAVFVASTALLAMRLLVGFIINQQRS